MKTKFLFMFITAVCITTAAFSSDTPKMSVIPLNNTKALVTIAAETPCVSEVTITDESGRIMYYKRSKNELSGYRKIFNLSNLEEGRYEMKVKAGSTTFKNDLEIKDERVYVKRQSAVPKPYFTCQDDFIKVSFLNQKKKNVNLNIYQNNELVYHSKLGNEFAIHRKIDISALQQGKYEVLLSSADEDYSFWVSK